MKDFGDNTEILWHDRKRWCGMPISFTRYYIVKKEGGWSKFFSSIGLFATSDEEVNLFRVFDLSVSQTLTDKLFGTGTITLHCNDESSNKVYLVRVKNPFVVKNMISDIVEKERANKNMTFGEFHY
ncbi:MAG: PH domain-containing protein [Clostridia bacterium]